MIEDEELGLKIAENPEESFWARVEKNSSIELKALNDAVKLQTSINEMAKEKLNSLKK